MFVEGVGLELRRARKELSKGLEGMEGEKAPILGPEPRHYPDRVHGRDGSSDA